MLKVNSLNIKYKCNTVQNKKYQFGNMLLHLLLQYGGQGLGRGAVVSAAPTQQEGRGLGSRPALGLSVWRHLFSTFDPSSPEGAVTRPRSIG